MTLFPHWADLSLADAKRAAAFVFADDDALASYELGETDYPANVETELNRMIDARNRKD
jgi:hypothetical protein